MTGRITSDWVNNQRLNESLSASRIHKQGLRVVAAPVAPSRIKSSRLSNQSQQFESTRDTGNGCEKNGSQSRCSDSPSRVKSSRRSQIRKHGFRVVPAAAPSRIKSNQVESHNERNSAAQACATTNETPLVTGQINSDWVNNE